LATKKTETEKKSIFDDELEVPEPVEYEDDPDFMHQGMERVIVLLDTETPAFKKEFPKFQAKVKKVVMRFHPDVPEELVWKPYATLHPEDKKLVDEIEPETRKGGQPKSKFATRYNLAFADKATGRKWIYDVSYYTNEDGTPWTTFRDFLKAMGADFTSRVKIGDYLHVGDEFTAVLVLKTDKRTGKDYLHLDPKTLTPKFDQMG